MYDFEHRRGLALPELQKEPHLFNALCFTCAQASPGIVAKLGPNWTLVLGYFQACIFFAAHLYPTIYALVPTYVLAGLALGMCYGHS